MTRGADLARRAPSWPPLPAALRRYSRHPAGWRAGNEVTLLRDGAEAYPAMLAAIAGARRRIELETYILADDHAGQRFAAALEARARAGIEVRLLYDAWGALGLSGRFVAGLAAAGVVVVVYNPLAPWHRRHRRFAMSERDHRKVMIVDDELAFTGGLNIGDDYAPVADGGAGWRDLHCAVRGPIVDDLGRGFRRTWLRAGGPPYPASPPTPADATPGTTLARTIDTTRRRRRPAIRRAYGHVLEVAQRRVLIQNAYFLPDRSLRRAMIRAVARGVEIQVIVPGRCDVRVVEWASLSVYRDLARRGVKILRWRGPMMHAKTAVVDDAWATIGSYNLDALSLNHNLELALEFLDPAVAAELTAEFLRTAAECDPFAEEDWLALPWWRRLFAWIAYRLRRWL
jgi:cardiolipin synthase